jgi:hypothetical protein
MSIHATAHSVLSLPSRWPNARTRGRRNPQNSSAVIIEVGSGNFVAPPIWEFRIAQAQTQTDNDGAEGSADIESAGQDIVVLS